MVPRVIEAVLRAKHLHERVQRSREVPQLIIDKTGEQNWPRFKVILHEEPGREEELRGATPI